MSKKSDAQIEKIIAACDGDVHGALRALTLVNEQLETECVSLPGDLHAVLVGRLERGLSERDAAAVTHVLAEHAEFHTVVVEYRKRAATLVARDHDSHGSSLVRSSFLSQPQVLSKGAEKFARDRGAPTSES